MMDSKIGNSYGLGTMTQHADSPMSSKSGIKVDDYKFMIIITNVGLNSFPNFP